MGTSLGRFVSVRSSSALESALVQARGCYQRNVLLGHESLSGSTLKGKAATQYRDRYAVSRRNLLSRVRAAGVLVSETRGARGRRVLVIG